MDQLDGTIEIPEVLHFACNDRSQLLDQLKVLQMVLRKERDKNKDSQLCTIDSSSCSSSKTQSSFTGLPSVEESLKEKVERHKKTTAQRRQDKLKQMDTEAQALSKVLANEERESLESVKVMKLRMSL